MSAESGANEAGPEAAPTSLDLYADTVFRTTDQPLCPKLGTFLVSQASGVMIPTSCRAYACPICGPRKARRLAMVASWSLAQVSHPRFVTLTQAPEDWPLLRQKMRNLRRYLARRGYAWESFWSVERGQETGMKHVHVLQHGDYIPQAELQQVWGSIVDIRGVGSSRVSSYVLKDAARIARYSTKGASDEGYDEHLELNGGRVAHWSRGFFHGKTLDEAFAVASTGGDEGPWVRMRP